MVVGKIKGEQVKDDKTMIMEQVIQLVANLNSDSKLRAELTNTFLGELWDSIDHPPLLYVGDKYEYRQADGSNNVCGPLEIILSLSLTFHRTQCFLSSVRPGQPTRGQFPAA